MGASGAGGDYEIEQSLRFNDDDGSYLSRTPSVAGNRKTWTWSGWVKRGNLSTTQALFGVHTDTNNKALMYFDSGNNDLRLYSVVSGSIVYLADTDAKFRDSSAWYHITAVMDTTQSTASDRMKIYINGVNQTLSINTSPSLNLDTLINSATDHVIGQFNTAYFDGYLAEVNFIDGQALTPDSFGATGDYGEWKAKSYAGGYGTNGFYLDFKSSGSLGNDAAGSNNWTIHNLAATDQMLDSPTNNFATLNVVDLRGTVTVSEGNLKASLAVNGNITGTIAPSSGKWYWEFYLDDISNPYIGLQSVNTAGSGSSGYSQDAVALNNAGDIFYDGGNQGGAFEGSPAWTIGDILGVAYNIDSDKMWWSLNGQWYSANAASQSAINVSEVLAGTSAYDLSSQITQGIPFLGSSASNGIVTTNFGQDSSFAGTKTPQGNQDSNDIGDFYYAPPTGFLALCTSNLPEVDVIPSEHFNTVIYSGNGASPRSLTAIGFQPDLVWNKARSVGFQHDWADSVRGGNKILHSNSTGAEDVDFIYGYLNSFDADGFTMQAGSTSIENWNKSGETYVAWNWKAGGSASSNTNGSITSSVSANPSAGFSIVSYTGTGANATVGHGLSVAPNMTWIKPRNFADNWIVTYDSVDGSDDQIYLNLSNAGGSPATQYAVAQNATTLGLTNWNNVNDANDTYIAYCFNSVESYSKVGSYVGNTSSTDGTFVHCGFAVKFLLIKDTGAGNTWVLLDSKRDSINPNDTLLQPQTSAAETTGWAGQVDFLSNGFKIRSNDNALNAARPYLFYAIAENPFKHTNAR